MPPYFTVTMQRKIELLTGDYVKRVYTTIIESGYPFKGGFGFHDKASFDEIVAWNQAKLEQGFRLGYTGHESQDYMQILFDAPAYSEMRGFWMHSGEDIAFNLVIPETNVAIEEGQNKSFEENTRPLQAVSVRLWEKGLANTIQSTIESDGGYYSISRVCNGENLMIHPFAVIPRAIIKKFGGQFFADMEATPIGNNGVLVNNRNFSRVCW